MDNLDYTRINRYTVDDSPITSFNNLVCLLLEYGTYTSTLSIPSFIENMYIMTNEIDHEFTYRLPTVKKADFIIQIFYLIYSNYGLYMNELIFLLNNIKSVFGVKTLKISPRMWVKTSFDKNHYAEFIISSGVPDKFIETWEHRDTVSRINNTVKKYINEESLNEHSSIYIFANNKTYDKNLLVIIQSYLEIKN